MVGQDAAARGTVTANKQVNSPLTLKSLQICMVTDHAKSLIQQRLPGEVLTRSLNQLFAGTPLFAAAASPLGREVEADVETLALALSHGARDLSPPSLPLVNIQGSRPGCPT